MTNQGNSSEVQAAIEAADEVFMATFSRGDAAALANLYTEKGHYCRPAVMLLPGRKRSRTFGKGPWTWELIRQGSKRLKWKDMGIPLSSKANTH